MRSVSDTNIWISWLLWRGLPWNLLRLAEMHQVELCISRAMLAELADVLEYERLQPRLQQLGLHPSDLIAYVLNLASVFDVPPAKREAIVVADPDDNIFVLCAVAARAAYIVSGDRHLLALRAYGGIPILSVRDFLQKEFADQIIT